MAISTSAVLGDLQKNMLNVQWVSSQLSTIISGSSFLKEPHFDRNSLPDTLTIRLGFL